MLTVVSLDPSNVREGEVYLNLVQLGLPGDTDGSFPCLRVTDELTGAAYEWSGTNYVRLDPFAGRVAHVLRVEPL